MALKNSIKRFLVPFVSISIGLCKDIGLYPILKKNIKNEPLARFIFSGDIRASDGNLKPRPFTPPRKSTALSVYRTINLEEEVIWRIGKYFVQWLRGELVIGRAEILSDAVSDTNKSLKIKRTYWPHPRHANIINYPPYHNDVMKQARKTIAKELASRASVIRSESI